MQTEDRFTLAERAFRRKIKTYAYRATQGSNTGSSAGSRLEMEAEDIEAELLAVLWKATLAYDPNNGASFNTFAQNCFQNHLSSLGRKQNAKFRQGTVVSLDVEAIAAAVEARNSSPSAEDEALCVCSVRELVAEETQRRAHRITKKAS